MTGVQTCALPILGVVDPSQDAVMRTIIVPNGDSNIETNCKSTQCLIKSYINSGDATINYRPTGTDSIYYTLYPVVDSTISPVTVSMELYTGDNNQLICPRGTKGRMGVIVGVTESGTNYDFGGAYSYNATTGTLSVYDTGWEQTPSNGTVTGTTTSEIRNKVLDASNNLYITVDAYTASQSGNTTEVTVSYTIDNGSVVTLGTLVGPSYSNNPNNKNTQTYTISRSSGDFVRILVEGESTTGGGAA